MSFFEAVEQVFKHYADFSGRARRSEFWYYMLFYWLVLTLLGILSAVLPGVGLLISLFSLGMLIPTLAVYWRRLHDTGRSGVWWLIGLIPLVGIILLIVWCAEPGQPGPNQYGPDPLGSRLVLHPMPVRSLLAVRCLAGPMQGQTFSVGSAGLLLGRRPDCHVRFPDGTPGVSAMHCRICWREGAPMLVDLGSRHGTFFGDGRRLPVNFPMPVAPGTRFYLGVSANLFECIAG